MKQIIIYCICTFYIGIGQAQILGDLLEKADSLYEAAHVDLEFPKDTNAHFPFSTSIPKKYDANYYQMQLKELEATQFKQDIGLAFKASTNYNFRDAFDEEQNNFNRFRFRAELEWHILKNGFIHNRTKGQQKYNEAENLKLQNRDATKQLWRRQFRIDYSYIANNETIELLTRFLNFENAYFDFLNKLYTEKYIKREQLIRVGNQIHILKSQLELVKQENHIIKDSISENALLKHKLSIFSIKADSISLSSEQYNNSFLQENMQLQHRAINDLSLSVYVNQNINYASTQSQYFPAVGIRFKAPIRFNKRQDIIKTKLQLLAAEEKNKNVGQYNTIITHINAYNEKLKDLQNQYKSWNILEERIRILNLLKAELNTYKTGLLILELTEEKFKVLENIIQIKRQLYTSFSHLYQLCPQDNLQDMLLPYTFEKEVEREAILFTRSAHYTLDFQFEFIRTKAQFSILVPTEDTGIQKYLKDKGVAYSMTTEKEIQTVSQLISNELQKLNI
ncbi:hypothetical protein [Seonamhaeicola sp.]|uniref:hypothetical protein n=1 Tax=Seonamhaeicola sp. TaxID=1912245 RepID=UPI0026312C8D|nr:hypothetical protein [Seonamhaeicola sp.]